MNHRVEQVCLLFNKHVLFEPTTASLLGFKNAGWNANYSIFPAGLIKNASSATFHLTGTAGNGGGEFSVGHPTDSTKRYTITIRSGGGAFDRSVTVQLSDYVGEDDGLMIYIATGRSDGSYTVEITAWD